MITVNKFTSKRVDKGLRHVAASLSCRPALLCAYFTLFICALVTFSGCDRRELTYYESAEITLTVDWSQSGLDVKKVRPMALPPYSIRRMAASLKSS